MMLSVILLFMLMILLFTLNFVQASHLWQQLELASKLESDLQDMWTGAGSGLLI